jgi:histidine triad (HIT) family protein|tara:strand:- start:559 stop:894 length:336 start_codon:yes stop_codon:yes gene_type:complete
MDDCIFCKIVKKEIPASIVYEDDELMAFKDINPIDKVHLLIIPKQHIESLLICDPMHKDILSKMLLLAPKLAIEFGLKGFRTMINSGKEGGQEVFHIHFHVYGGSERLAKI